MNMEGSPKKSGSSGSIPMHLVTVKRQRYPPHYIPYLWFLPLFHASPFITFSGTGTLKTSHQEFSQRRKMDEKGKKSSIHSCQV
jgi:hypothetical protein